MEIVLSALTGILYTTGIYLLLRRSIVKLILGIIFLGNATNFLVFLSGGIGADNPVFISGNNRLENTQFADPLPQALVLTAIIIGFGISALILVVSYKYYQKTGTNDLDNIKESE